MYIPYTSSLSLLAFPDYAIHADTRCLIGYPSGFPCFIPSPISLCGQSCNLLYLSGFLCSCWHTLSGQLPLRSPLFHILPYFLCGQSCNLLYLSGFLCSCWHTLSGQLPLRSPLFHILPYFLCGNPVTCYTSQVSVVHADTRCLVGYPQISPASAPSLFPRNQSCDLPLKLVTR